MAGLGKIGPCESNSELLLLVEGVNDCHAIRQLAWLIYRAEPVFGVCECGNDNKLLDRLAALPVLSGPGQRVLGLVLDADIEGLRPDQVIQARLDQLVARVGTYYPLPAVFPEEGLIVDPHPGGPAAARLPRLGVWLMPNNKAYGMFEDLLMASLSDQVTAYTTKVVRQSKDDGIAKFKDTHRSKAVIRTYMAWQDPPDIQHLGVAIRAGVFENIEAECGRFVQWLERLFGRPAHL
jgi:hypothetical protein